MSDLKFEEKKLFEKLFQMEDGYVLDMSDRDFEAFFLDQNIDIQSEKFSELGKSKAKRLRMFWRVESNHVVAKINRRLLTYLAISSDKGELLQKAENILSQLELSCLAIKEPLPKSKKPPSSSDSIKKSVQNLAHQLWVKNPYLKQSDIIRKKELIKMIDDLSTSLKCQSPRYDTIRKWLKEIDPRPQELKQGPKSK